MLINKLQKVKICSMNTHWRWTATYATVFYQHYKIIEDWSFCNGTGQNRSLWPLLVRGSWEQVNFNLDGIRTTWHSNHSYYWYEIVRYLRPVSYMMMEYQRIRCWIRNLDNAIFQPPKLKMVKVLKIVRVKPLELDVYLYDKGFFGGEVQSALVSLST